MSTELGMEGLTEEERAALAEDDTESPTATQEELEAQAALANDTGATDATEQTSKDTGGNNTGVAAPAGEPAAAAGEGAAQQPAAAATEPAAAPSLAPSAPILVAEAPADADAKLTEIAGKKDAVIAKFDDGDITAKEMQAELDALGKQEREIERAIDRAEIAAGLEEQRRKNEWATQCDGFLKDHAEYDGGKGERFEHLNETLIALAKMPRNASLTGPELLEKAHKLVKAERGEVLAPPAAGKEAAKPAVVPKPALPPNLAGLPSAASNDPGEGKYASLDRLQSANPEGYEAALAKMSDAERDAYLAA